MAYSTIDKQSLHFNTKIYSGTNSTNAQTGVGFQPDITWIKDRTQANHNNNLMDSVRGAPKILITDTNAAEVTDSTDALTSFDTDGFTLGANTTGTQSQELNKNGNNYVSWNWLAGGNAPTKTYKVVVVSDSGNKYRFRNSGDTATFGASAVTLDLQEGGTYTFDVSDSTLNSHPFVIGTAANSSEYSSYSTYKLDGVTKTYSQYTSGFSAATSRQLILNVPASAPALYYWCSQHSGMGGAINTNSTHGSSNFDGAIQSLVSANSTSGVSVVKWTSNGSNNDQLGHGLSGTPKIVLYRRWDSTNAWYMWLNGVIDGSQDYIELHNTDNKVDVGASYGNHTASTISNYGYGNGNNLIAYCFEQKIGFSKFGVFHAGGDDDNSFVYTGFAPQLVVIKPLVSDSWSNWYAFDNVRDKNLNDKPLYWNLATQEAYYGGSPATNYAQIDLYSNGFKVRRDGSWGGGGNGQQSLYLAFGQTQVGSNNVPTTAR